MFTSELKISPVDKNAIYQKLMNNNHHRLHYYMSLMLWYDVQYCSIHPPQPHLHLTQGIINCSCTRQLTKRIWSKIKINFTLHRKYIKVIKIPPGTTHFKRSNRSWTNDGSCNFPEVYFIHICCSYRDITLRSHPALTLSPDLSVIITDKY